LFSLIWKIYTLSITVFGKNSCFNTNKNFSQMLIPVSVPLSNLCFLFNTVELVTILFIIILWCITKSWYHYTEHGQFLVKFLILFCKFYQTIILQAWQWYRKYISKYIYILYIYIYIYILIFTLTLKFMSKAYQLITFQSLLVHNGHYLGCIEVLKWHGILRYCLKY
jgi:hypothetical protein